MKKILCTIFSVIIIAGTLALSGCSRSKGSTSSGTLTVAMELAYPPFEMKDAQGNPSGVSVDFAKDFGASIGKKVVIDDIAWDGLIPALQTGKADLIISSMTITDSRKQVVDFSIPYANSLLAILANKKSNISSIDDLNRAGKKVAVKIGTTADIYAQNNLKNAQIIELSDESACATEVAEGKADGFIYDQLSIYRDNQSNPTTTTAIYIPFQNVEYWGVAVKKGNTVLLNQVNNFITKYRAEGGFDKLTQKYLANEKQAFDKLGFKWFFDMK